MKDIALRPLREKEVLVEIVASGICQTDLHFAGLESGTGIHYPRIMGHEGECILLLFDKKALITCNQALDMFERKERIPMWPKLATRSFCPFRPARAVSPVQGAIPRTVWTSIQSTST